MPTKEQTLGTITQRHCWNCKTKTDHKAMGVVNEEFYKCEKCGATDVPHGPVK